MQNKSFGLRMEPFSLRHNTNPTYGGIRTSHPNSLSSSEHNFVQYLDTIIGSTNPQVRPLRRHAKVEYLEEKKIFESILITPLCVLSLKSHEINTRLWEALIYDFNPDSGAIAQFE